MATAHKKTKAAKPLNEAMSDARIDARVHVLAQLREMYPVLFSIDNPRPLKIGIHHDLIALGMPKQAVKDALAWWCGRPDYYRTLSPSGVADVRYDLDGAVVGAVSEGMPP